LISPALRAAWLARQGLAEPLSGGVAELVARTGWIPSAGGQCPYLAIRARRPDLARADVDSAVTAGERLVEVPAVRGVTMLVPEVDAALALRAARRFEVKRWEKLKSACRITDASIDRLAEAILSALDRAGGGPLSGDAIRDAVPARLVQSLGEPGKKLGDATTLPVALRRLVVAGDARRVPAGARLDASRFAWVRAEPSSVSAIVEEDIDRELAARFLAWAGPSTRAELAAWAGISQAAAKAAMAELDLALFPPDRSVLGQDRGDLSRAAPPSVHFLPFRDNYTFFRKTIGGPEVSTHHLVVVDGAAAGMWEWEPERQGIVWATHEKLPAELAEQAHARAEALAEFVRSDLGDVRFYALDNEKNRGKRLAAIYEISRRARPKGGR
jgi:hypothetical protein